MTRLISSFVRDLYNFLFFPVGQFRGIYRTFQEAELAVPVHKRSGFDTSDVAASYETDVTTRLDSTEYSALFHLGRAVKDDSTVLDYGGNIGISYLHFARHLKPATFKWIVLDVPEIVRAGRRVCTGMPEIAFVSSLTEITEPKMDVFFCSAAFQYVDLASPSVVIRALIDKKLRPSVILIDTIPLTDGREFVTLQNGGASCYPMRVANRAAFLGDIASLGYDLVDEWSVKHYRCAVPFHRSEATGTYSGVLFRDKTPL